MAERISGEQADALAGRSPAAPQPVAAERPEDGLEILGPEPETFQTSQGPISVGPMNMGQIQDVMAHGRRFLPALRAGLQAGREIDLAGFLAEPELYQAVAAGLGTTVEKVRKMGLEEFSRLVTKWIVVNVDFFVRVLPREFGRAYVSVAAAVRRLAASASPPSTSSSAATP